MADSMEMNNSVSVTDSNDIIDLGDLFHYLLSYWFLILIGFLAGALALGCYAYTRPNTYTSSASMFIQSKTTSLTSLADIQLGNALSEDFIVLATSKPVLDSAITTIEKETGITLTRENIQSSIRIENVSDTRLLVFYATTGDPVLSKTIAQAMADATANQVSYIMKSETPTRVELAELAEPNHKRTKLYAAIGGLVGILIPSVILIVLFLLNDKVVTEEDVKKHLKVNVLGSISLDRANTYKKRG